MMVAAASEREARACGGCIPPPAEIESLITDEKMILSISKDQTTLFDEIRYSGSPSSFAWVLPIRGTVTVGLSADVMFTTLDTLTASEVVQPTPNCPAGCYALGGRGAGAGGSGGPGECAGGACGTPSNNGGVTVLAQEQVGPYETVQLESTDGSALFKWLNANGYPLPAADKPVVNAYVAEHFNFLALKLVPGKGVKTMQPVRVTSTGASISLPLHMVAIGTGPTTGITIWVVADGRWETQNFPTFTITDSELEWDWTTSSSNYETLRLSKEAAFGGRGWQIESSLELNQASFLGQVITNIQYNPTKAGLYTPVTTGPSGDGGTDAAGGKGAGSTDASAADASAAIEQAAMEDIGVLFAGVAKPNARVTRMRSDVAHSALSADMYLQAASDQSEMTNIHTPEKQVGQPPCSCGVGSGGVGGQGGGDFGGGGAGSPPRAAPQESSSAGCNTTGSLDETSTTLVGLFALSGFVAVRLRRRSRK
jgi:hypothetical protein